MKFNSFIQTIQYHKMFTKHILRPTSQQYLKRLIANNVAIYIYIYVHYVQQFDRRRENCFLSINLIICLHILVEEDVSDS